MADLTFLAVVMSPRQLSSRLTPLLRGRLLLRPVHTSAPALVTDIQYYREVDQSHMHLVEAQSKSVIVFYLCIKLLRISDNPKLHHALM